MKELPMSLPRTFARTLALLVPVAAIAQSAPAPNNGPLTPTEQRAVRAFQCLAHMRGIAQAINVYGVDHDDKPPPDLGTLCLDASVDLPNFVCPGGGGAVPDNWKTMKPQEQAAWVNAHADYILIPGKLDFDANAPLLIEKPDDHAPTGANVAFRDSHVQFLSAADIKKLLGPNPPTSETTRVKAEPGKASPIPLPSRLELQTDQVRFDISVFKTALAAFEVDNGRYPTTAEGLNALVSKPAGAAADWHQYVAKLPNDPWGHLYLYSLKSPDHPEVSSAGPDGKPNTSDDIKEQEPPTTNK
jgi:type II secretion system protein G